MWIQYAFLLAYDLLVGGLAGLQKRWGVILAAHERHAAHSRRSEIPFDWQTFTAWGLIFSAVLWLCFLPLTLMMKPMNRTVESQQRIQHQVIQAFPQAESLEESMLVLQPFSPKQQQKLSSCLTHSTERHGLSKPKPARSERLKHLTFPPVLLNHSELSQMMGTRRLARSLGRDGQVVARVLVDEQGKYVEHRIIRSDSPVFRLAMEEELKHLVFLPAIQAGTPTHRWTEVRFHFIQ